MGAEAACDIPGIRIAYPYVQVQAFRIEEGLRTSNILWMYVAAFSLDERVGLSSVAEPSQDAECKMDSHGGPCNCR